MAAVVTPKNEIGARVTKGKTGLIGRIQADRLSDLIDTRMEQQQHEDGPDVVGLVR